MTGVKRRKKNYYLANTKRSKDNFLDSSVERGFLITIDPKQERKATLSAYSLLNEAADRLYGPQEKAQTEGSDIEAELQAIRKDGCRFKKLRTEFFATIFIETSLEKPVEIISNVFEHMPNNMHHIVRFVPVLGTCKTQPENVSKKVLEILAENYPESDETIPFMIQLKSRHNNEYKETAKRQGFCQALATAVQEANSRFVPDLKDPSLVINIDILQKIGCISLLPDFKRFKKYNPGQFAVQMPKQPAEEIPASTKKDSEVDTAESGEVAIEGNHDKSLPPQETAPNELK